MSALQPILLALAFCGYALASGLYIRGLISPAKVARRLVMPLLAGGLAAHLATIVIHTVQTGQPPFASVFETMSLMGALIVLVFSLVGMRWRLGALGGFALPLGVLLFVAGVLGQAGRPPEAAAARATWLVGVHIGLTLLGYAAFTLAFCAALVYLIQDRLLKVKHLTGLSRHLPSVHAADEAAYRMVALGFPVFTLGLLLGAVGAYLAEGSYFLGSQKEIWSWVTWLIFAVYLHARGVSGWRGRRAALLVVIGFGCLLTTYLVTGLIGVGWHRFV